MSEKASSTSLWLKFFRGAGIPGSIDTKYALIFDENRIRMDMLMDLNKEILRDMGINAMGDIIAILKHAKKVHDETKEQAVEPNKPTQSQASSTPSKVSASSTQGRSSGSSQSAGRPVVVESVTEAKSPSAAPAARAKHTATPTAGTSRVPERIVQTKGQPQSQSQVEKTRQETPLRKMIVLNKRSSSEGPLKEEVPVQKKIRVLPEQEGKYTIKMPEGTTARTKKIIQSRLGPGPPVSTLHSTADKKTVFARLGDSSVSSSTEDSRGVSQSSGVSDSKTTGSQPAKQSVFDRLGGRGKHPESSASISSANSQPKALLQMKVSVPEQASSVRSRLDTKTHQEKTLKTIPSRISIPYLTNRAKVRSEISSAVTSATTTTTTRIISAKSSSVPSSTMQRNPARTLTSRISEYSRSGNREPTVRMRGISDLEDSDYDADQGGRVGSSSRASSSSLEKRVQDIIRSPAPPPVDGQVLQTIRMPSKTKGKVIVKKLIYKKIPKTSVSTELAHLPEIEDPLANYYDDSDD